MTIDRHLQERLDVLLVLVQAGKPLKEALPRAGLTSAWYNDKIPEALKAPIIRAKKEWAAQQLQKKERVNEVLFLKVSRVRKANIKTICKAKGISVARAVNSLLAGYEEANRHLLESPAA